jgi:error-prone DNA polymerase
MVSEVISYRGKSALREVGKVFGLSPEQLDRLSSTIIHWESSAASGELLKELGLDPEGDRLKKVLALARELEGFPRHLSIHVGGFVLSSEPLVAVAPIEPGRMLDRTVVPWDKDDIDALGFFKIDVLGLGMLTAIRKSLALMHEDGFLRAGEGEAFDPIDTLARVPAEDPGVYEMVSRGDTVGVFQIESRAQMAMLPRLRPRCFYDLVIEVALVRPGPIQGGMVHPYLRRRAGEEKVTFPHPSLRPILERTLGVPLFQEQVMQIAITGAGYSAGEADQLRRDMAAWRRGKAAPPGSSADRSR